MLLDRNADPDSVKNSRYEPASKKLANKKKFHFSRADYSLLGAIAWKYYSRRFKEENIAAVTVEILRSYSR
jgi:hypothetical protein